MEASGVKTILRGILGALLALVVFLIAWLVISVIYGLVGMARDEGELWKVIMKDAVAPGMAAYVAFEAVAKFMQSLDWRVTFGIFAASIAVLATLNLAFTSEFYLSQGRVSDWHMTLIATGLNAVAATIGAFVSYREHFST